LGYDNDKFASELKKHKKISERFSEIDNTILFQR